MHDRPEQSEETLLVLSARQGDPAAFRSLVERYDRRLLYFVRRMLDDPEEGFDVLQRVWTNVFRQLPRLQTPQAFRVWLYRIAHDQAVSALRKKRIEISIESLPLNGVPDDNQKEAAFETAEALHVALQSLSVDHRRVLTLRFLEDMSLEEIATVLDCSTGTIKSRLHYARAALRRRIEEDEHG
jgi:RNA polymerase sigma-70 factor (ECF subfamily)